MFPICNNSVEKLISFMALKKSDLLNEIKSKSIESSKEIPELKKKDNDDEAEYQSEVRSNVKDMLKKIEMNKGKGNFADFAGPGFTHKMEQEIEMQRMDTLKDKNIENTVSEIEEHDHEHHYELVTKADISNVESSLDNSKIQLNPDKEPTFLEIKSIKKEVSQEPVKEVKEVKQIKEIKQIKEVKDTNKPEIKEVPKTDFKEDIKEEIKEDKEDKEIKEKKKKKKDKKPFDPLALYR